ncbi:type II toxin-antitoxin system PemK/MazF family toxin [Macrococcus bovicus]|uniref:type II toxin-antitoxin system PemK/MazF family toxin n=1 Tax=Macrococcus bovicus TaxID=69968 RepID=UPI0025A56429|nr:type II toxin-antitoxin system PemK/MazF family toxin [Macrococcus bovicus]WJP96732.1 type II toxin-antitoxin system PemK/MazF family toxin [Macrococcus bovicus]
MVSKVSQGDIFYVNFNPSRGHEQKNHRPALAISHDMVRDNSDMTIVVPISQTDRDFPMYYPLTTTQLVKGKVLLDQSIALDLTARNVTADEVVETLSKEELEKIINRYKLLFTID